MIALRPSGSDIWTKCAANPLFTDHAPPMPETDAAREGTCAAWVAECVLRGHAPGPDAGSMATHENGWVVTPDMCFYVQGYVDLVRSRGGKISAEGFVRLNEFIAGTFDSSVDASDLDGWVFVDDLKYGHKGVEVYENNQVLIYAEAECRRLESLGRIITNVQLGIYQPRAWHPDGIYRTWQMTRAELATWAEWIIARGSECQVPQPVATPGRHCGYCKAAGVCYAAKQTAADAYDAIRDHRHRQLTTAEFRAELDFLDLAEAVIKGRKTAIHAEAEARLKKGEFVPGWHLKERHGHRVFNATPLTVRALTGIDPVKPTMKTPAELEREGASPEILKSLTYQPPLSPSLSRLAENTFRKAFDK